MTLTFRPCDLPNPILLTAPENLAYMREKEAEAEVNVYKANAKSGAKKRKQDEGENVENSNRPKRTKTTARKSTRNIKPGKASAQPKESENSESSDPPKRTKTTAKKSTKSSVPGKQSATEKKSTKGASAQNDGDIFCVTLDGDDNESVEMYDSCDEIRKKIASHLRTTGSSKAAFLRDIAHAGWPNSPPKIQSKQLSDFLDKSGATAGSTSRVFYGAYVYFEKKRIFEKKPKSQHRMDMEDQWEDEGGMPRERPQTYIVGAGMEVYSDELGRARCY